MRFHSIMIALLAGLGLAIAGCNQPPEDPAPETVATSAAAVPDELIITTDGSLPPDFPKGLLKPLAGATIDRAGTGVEGSLLEMTTKQPVDQASEFYFKHFTDRGFVAGEPQTAGASRMQSFTYEDNTISLTTLARSGGNMISLVLTTVDVQPDDELPADLVAANVVTLPDGFPVDILPRYPDSRLESAELTEQEASYRQGSTDSPTQIFKFYEEHFATLGIELTEDMVIDSTRYVAFAYSNGDPGGIGITFNTAPNGRTSFNIGYEFNWVPREE